MKQRADLVGASSVAGNSPLHPEVTRGRANRLVRVIPWLLQIGAMIGIAILLYPSAADWFASRAHNAEVSGYLRDVANVPASELITQREIAHQYNASVPAGLLQDPFTTPQMSAAGDASKTYENYLDILRVGENETIGELVYPDVGISLPIYPGTEDESLRKGVGHVYGSSLPVGGESTHAVLTSHSGLVNASLFTNLFDAEPGHVFSVSVLGERHYYQVQSLETVLPEQTQSLKVVEGEDRLTLITCTPIGVNSHRLLVHAQSIEAPLTDTDSVIAGDGITAGFPWWLLFFCGGTAIAGYLIFGRRSEQISGGRHRLSRQIQKAEQ